MAHKASNVVRVITRSIVVGIIRNVKKPNRAFGVRDNVGFEFLKCQNNITTGQVQNILYMYCTVHTDSMKC